MPEQISTFRLCDSYFRFHIAEYRLLFIARYQSGGESLDTKVPTPLSFAYNDCVDAALGLASLFQTVFVDNQYLPYCFNLVWVSLAVTSIWLVKNMAAMDQVDRRRVTESLTQVRWAAHQASNSVDDMAAYMYRLLDHLLRDLPNDRDNSGSPSPPVSHSLSVVPLTRNTHERNMPTAQQFVQHHLRARNDATHPTNHQSSRYGPTARLEARTELVPASHHNVQLNDQSSQHLPMGTNLQSTPVGNVGSDPLLEAVLANYGYQDDAVPLDVLFPAADDDFWQVSAWTISCCSDRTEC